MKVYKSQQEHLKQQKASKTQDEEGPEEAPKSEEEAQKTKEEAPKEAEKEAKKEAKKKKVEEPSPYHVRAKLIGIGMISGHKWVNVVTSSAFRNKTRAQHMTETADYHALPEQGSFSGHGGERVSRRSSQ
ncbi:Ankyrin-like protein, partial [Phytophthora palmivora]